MHRSFSMTTNHQLAVLFAASILCTEPLLSAVATQPTGKPVQGQITSGFGYREDPFTGRIEHHDCADIAAPKGTAVVATGEGQVLHTGWQQGYGLSVTIRHGSGLATRYGHLNQVGVEGGQPVRRGDIIGFVGTTGRATGPHLHYEILQDGRPRNPVRSMREEVVTPGRPPRATFNGMREILARVRKRLVAPPTLTPQ